VCCGAADGASALKTTGDEGETMRARSLIAISAIIGGLIVYALAVMLVAEALPAYWPVQAVFFAVAGLVWILPAAGFVRWGVGKRPPPAR
jgi:hypothetical protein